MATVINNPPQTSGNNGSNMGLIVGILAVIIIVALFILLILPALRGVKTNSGTNINVPDKINVNVNK